MLPHPPRLSRNWRGLSRTILPARTSRGADHPATTPGPVTQRVPRPSELLVTIRNSSPEPCRRDQTQNPQARRPPALTERQWAQRLPGLHVSFLGEPLAHKLPDVMVAEPTEPIASELLVI